MAKSAIVKSRPYHGLRASRACSRLAAVALPAVMLAIGLTTGSGSVRADEADAQAGLHDRSGADLGTVAFTATPNGLRLHARLHGLPSGTHGFHLHAIGRCVGDFKSAGGHFNPAGTAHGFDVAGGPHQGDMPNIHVTSSGLLEIEVFLPGVKLAGPHGLLDEDGAALVIHEGADDYASQPSGAAGPRIACGVIGEGS